MPPAHKQFEAITPTSVLVEVEPNEVSQLQGRSSHWVLAMLLDVGHHIDYVIDGPVIRAHRVLKGSEGYGAAVEGQALEGRPLLVLVASKLLVLAGCHIPPVLLRAFLTHLAAAAVGTGTGAGGAAGAVASTYCGGCPCTLGTSTCTTEPRGLLLLLAWPGALLLLLLQLL